MQPSPGTLPASGPRRGCSRAGRRSVIGPVPPGIGVIAPAIACTASKSTSPTMPASVRDTPTSTTAAPGLTWSAVIIRADPAAAMMMSASRHTPARSAVRRVGERHRGVDALAAEQQHQRQPDERRAADDDRTLARRRRRRSGRAGASRRAACTATCPGWPRTRRPIEQLGQPVDVLLRRAAGRAPARGRARRAAAAGTRMPCTAGSAASAPTASSTSACDAVSGSSTPSDRMPASSAFLCFDPHVDLARLVVADEHRRQAHRRRSGRLDLARAADARSRRGAGCRPSAPRHPACARTRTVDSAAPTAISTAPRSRRRRRSR